MYDTRIVKFKLRRGTNAQREQVTFKQGELIYTSDLKRCFVGDGVTIGGNHISNINSISTTFPAFSAVGDFVYRSDLQRTYVCTASGYEYIGPYPDTTTIEFSGNFLQVVSGCITKEKMFIYIAALSGGLTFDNINGLAVSHNNTFEINGSNRLRAKLDSTDDVKITETTRLTASDLTLTSASLKTYLGILTADGTFLVASINGKRQGIRLWKPPLIDVAPPGPPPPPAETEFILAEDLSPIISNDGDNIVWTNASRNYLLTEDGEYIMTEDTDDILWDA
jgi:hypothetical protein